MFGDTAAFDGNAGTSGNSSDLPFVNNGNGSVVAQPSSFWSNLGGGLTKGLTDSLPAVLSNLTSRSDPNPKSAALEQRTTAQKAAAQSGSIVKWVLIGVAVVAAVGGVIWLVLRGGKKRG